MRYVAPRGVRDGVAQCGRGRGHCFRERMRSSRRTPTPTPPAPAPSPAGITFQPAINDRSRSVEGRLRILEDPESYVARLAAEAAVAADRVSRAAAEAAVNEMAECTFHPQVSMRCVRACRYAVFRRCSSRAPSATPRAHE